MYEVYGVCVYVKRNAVVTALDASETFQGWLQFFSLLRVATVKLRNNNAFIMTPSSAAASFGALNFYPTGKIDFSVIIPNYKTKLWTLALR